ncbi:MAG: helix-turn-helix domain-containing protein [Lentisphaeria bacterium]|nr:helix-turn-helix domain-containing protein [Lentisphaeria bacterium]
MADLYLKNEDFLRKKQLPLVLLRRDPQPEFPLHSHESSELVIVTRGQGKHILPGSERNISAGDVFLIHGKTRHAYSDLHDLALYNIMFDLKEFNHPLFALQGKSLLPSLFLLKVPDGGVHLTGEEFQAVFELVRKMEDEQTSAAEDSDAMISALFMQLILLLGRSAVSAGITRKSPQYSRVDELVDEITEHSARKWSRAEMAKKAGMSLSTLTRHFRERTGVSPLEYLIRVRLKKASVLLQNPELGLAEIADMTGFTDSNYFCRLFRKYFGISPGKYRQK